MFDLKNYQEKHITECEHKINEFLNLEPNKICVFKSPTGSGKTIMIAELVERLVKNRSDEKEIAFIWISVHKLHDQSKEKLEKYYGDLQIISCSFFEDLQDRAEFLNILNCFPSFMSSKQSSFKHNISVDWETIFFLF